MPTPAFIREAAKSALDDGLTFYNHPAGRPDLRAAIKTYLDRLYGIDLDAARVIVPGSTMLGVSMAARMTLGRRPRPDRQSELAQYRPRVSDDGRGLRLRAAAA